VYTLSRRRIPHHSPERPPGLCAIRSNRPARRHFLERPAQFTMAVAEFQRPSGHPEPSSLVCAAHRFPPATPSALPAHLKPIALSCQTAQASFNAPYRNHRGPTRPTIPGSSRRGAPDTVLGVVGSCDQTGTRLHRAAGSLLPTKRHLTAYPASEPRRRFRSTHQAPLQPDGAGHSRFANQSTKSCGLSVKPNHRGALCNFWFSTYVQSAARVPDGPWSRPSVFALLPWHT